MESFCGVAASEKGKGPYLLRRAQSSPRFPPIALFKDSNDLRMGVFFSVASIFVCVGFKELQAATVDVFLLVLFAFAEPKTTCKFHGNKMKSH